MKIAQVTAYWGPAYPTGSGVFCYEISKRLAKQFEIHVFTSSIGNFNNLTNIDNLYVHPLRTYATIWNMNPLANALTPLLKSDFDIIHVHSYIFFLSNMAALVRLFKSKARYILHFNGGLQFPRDTKGFHPGRIWAKEKIYDKTLGYFTARMADRLLSASKTDIPIIQRKFGIREVGWVPNAVDTDKFLPLEGKPNSPTVTYVGKLEKWKGIDVLINCFKIINQKEKDIEFMVVGTGSLEGEMKRTGLPIKFLGHVPYENMPEIYQKTSVLLLPSYMEGFPCTLVESLACGVPVVATDVGDTKEIVLNGDTGFLIKPGGAEEATSRVIEILRDNNLSKAMRERGRKHVKANFSYTNIIEKIIEEYQNYS